MDVLDCAISVKETLHNVLRASQKVAWPPQAITFTERLDWEGVALDPGFRRVRVMARQTYVFTHAALGGWTGAGELARRGAELLMGSCRGEDGQFVSRIAPNGTVVDAQADLYDIAFGLFALAWWYRLSDDKRALDVALEVARLTLTSMRSNSGAGLVTRLDGGEEHQQNPHMHLFEAALFLASFTQHELFADLAHALFDHARERMIDAQTGTLPEFFDAQWVAKATDGAVRIEPGHHYEWTWLLCRYAQLSGRDEAFDIADRLFAFAETHGHDPATGLIFDCVDPDGRVTGRNLRIWPNLEYLKALVAMRERHPSHAAFGHDRTAAVATTIVRHFLSPGYGAAHALPTGLWIDYLDGAEKTPLCDHIPVSTLYHIMFAFSELLRDEAGHAPFSGFPW